MVPGRRWFRGVPGTEYTAIIRPQDNNIQLNRMLFLTMDPAEYRVMPLFAGLACGLKRFEVPAHDLEHIVHETAFVAFRVEGKIDGTIYSDADDGSGIDLERFGGDDAAAAVECNRNQAHSGPQRESERSAVKVAKPPRPASCPFGKGDGIDPSGDFRSGMDDTFCGIAWMFPVDRDIA